MVRLQDSHITNIKYNQLHNLKSSKGLDGSNTAGAPLRSVKSQLLWHFLSRVGQHFGRHSAIARLCKGLIVALDTASPVAVLL